MTTHFGTDDLLPLCDASDAPNATTVAFNWDQVDCVECLKLGTEAAGARERRLALGRVAYEEFASQRIVEAGATGKRVSMPAWRAGPMAFGMPQTELSDREREIWSHVAEAVAAAIPFVLTDAVMEAAWGHVQDQDNANPHDVREQIRAAATAAEFRVVEQ